MDSRPSGPASLTRATRGRRGNERRHPGFTCDAQRATSTASSKTAVHVSGKGTEARLSVYFAGVVDVVETTSCAKPGQSVAPLPRRYHQTFRSKGPAYGPIMVSFLPAQPGAACRFDAHVAGAHATGRGDTLRVILEVRT